MLYDHRHGSTWQTPLTISTLEFVISDSYPNIYFENQHVVNALTVSGSFCVCSFEKLKVASMNFDVVLGSLSVVQNSVYEENKVVVQTPHGTHCVAGATVNTVDTACPIQTTRDAGITATFVDTSSY
jgi:hypothetical protein